MKSKLLFFMILSLSYRLSSQNVDNLKYESLSDIDGNIYKTIRIGDQLWMGENLKTKKFNDGTLIPFEIDPSSWCRLSTPAYCYYNNDAELKEYLGGLYNWYAVITAKLCPIEWHVPSIDEWNIMVEYLGGEKVAGYKLKETGANVWKGTNKNSTNESGFAALPGGNREFINGFFMMIGVGGYWWTSSPYNKNFSWRIYLNNNNGRVKIDFAPNREGYSVRCLKD